MVKVNEGNEDFYWLNLDTRDTINDWGWVIVGPAQSLDYMDWGYNKTFKYNGKHAAQSLLDGKVHKIAVPGAPCELFQNAPNRRIGGCVQVPNVRGLLNPGYWRTLAGIGLTPLVPGCVLQEFGGAVDQMWA